MGDLFNILAQLGLFAFSKDYRKGLTGSGLTTAQVEQNQFNAGEAEAARQFNSSEAALQRQWEEDMYNTRYQRQVTDMQAAGVNPAIMFGGGQSPASVPSGASASGPAASGSTPANPSAALLDSLGNMMMIGSQIDLNRALARKYNAEGQNFEIKNLSEYDLNQASLRLLGTESDLNRQRIKESIQTVKTGAADEALKRVGVDRTQAESALLALQAIDQGISNKNRQDLYDLQKELLAAQSASERSGAAMNYTRIREIQASIGKIYAETLTESYKQGALSAAASRDLSVTRYTDLQGDQTEIDNQYRNLYDKVQIGVMVTEGLDNVGSAADHITGSVGNLFGGAFKGLKSLGKNFTSSSTF